MTGWTTLVDAETLASHLHGAGLRVFDCRFALNDTAAGEQAWQAGHLPGARYAHLDRDLSGPHAPGAGRHPWPSAAAFGDWLGRNGVTPETQVVAYDAGDGAFAARLWWLLRVAGHARVAVLDGGFARWSSLGLPVDTDATDVVATQYPVRFDAARLLDADAVAARLAAGGVLVDARAGERFRGEVEPIDRVAGHVPGAINRPYPANLDDGRFKPAARLAEEFGAMLGDRPATDVIAMCGSGVTACHHLLAMAHAGMPGASLFTGSWSGWIEDPQRAIATGAH
ncbi:MAG: sulfurtransferase [Xanthomonadaceae bacterium]|nr:sulfurtransferase [Xanthomonadaceae bacterium]